MPGEELADTVYLVIVLALRERGELELQVVKPWRFLGEEYVPGLNPGGLGMQTGQLVLLGGEWEVSVR